MADVLSAMSMAGGILLAVVVLMVIVCMTAVKRGEESMHRAGHDSHGGHKH
jgi:hypothetical protein